MIVALRVPALLAVVAAVSGCAPRVYESRPLAPASAAALLAGRALDAASLRDFLAAAGARVEPWPPARWDVATLTLAALHFHPDVVLAGARWRVREAATLTAASRPNPVLEVPLEHHGDEDAGTDGPWSVGAALGFTIETACKRAARQARAQARAVAARHDLQAAAWAVRARVRAACAALEHARAASELAARRSAAAAEALALLERRAELGEASAFETGATRLEAQRARLAGIAVQAELAVARLALADAVGLAPGAFDAVEVEPLPAPAAVVPDVLVLQSQALTGRADLLAQLARYAAAEAALRLEIARQYPDIELAPGYFFDQGDHLWTLGTALALPLLDRNAGPIAQAEATRALRAAEFEALQYRAVAQVGAAHARLASTRAQADAAAGLLAQARERAAAVERRRALGEADRLEVVRAGVEVLDAQAAVLAARQAAQAAMQALEEAVQQPLDGSVFAVPAALAGDAP